jgi:hypothetical protein
MARIPTYRRVATIPGPNQMAMPRARPEAFGALEARVMAQSGQNISDFVIKDLKDKQTKEAKIYANKIISSTRANMAERAVTLRRTTDGDIAPVLDTEMKNIIADAQINAPNQMAYDMVTLGLRTMGGTINARTINNDSIYRDKRLLLSNDEAHTNDKSTVYNSYPDLEATLASSTARINALNINPTEKRALQIKQSRELGYDAVRGQIDVGVEQAEAMLKELNNPTRDEYFAKILHAKDKQTLIKYANTTIRSYRAEERANNTAHRLAHNDQQRDLTTHWLDKILDPKDTVTIEQIRTGTVNIGGVDVTPDGKTLNFLKSFIDKEGQQKPPVDQRTQGFIDALDLIDDAKSVPATYGERKSDVEEYLKVQLTKGFISTTEFRALLKELNAPFNLLKKEYIKLLKNDLTRSNDLLGIKDPEGDEFFLEAYKEMQNIITKYENDDKLDVMDLFDKNSPHYLHTKLSRFKRSAQEKVKASIKKLVPKKPKTNVGTIDPNDTTVNRVKNVLNRAARLVEELFD